MRKNIIAFIILTFVLIALATIAFAEQLIVKEHIYNEDESSYVITLGDATSCLVAAKGISRNIYDRGVDRNLTWRGYEYIRFVCVAGTGVISSSGLLYQIPKSIKGENCLFFDPEERTLKFDDKLCDKDGYTTETLLVGSRSSVNQYFSGILEEQKSMRERMLSKKPTENGFIRIANFEKKGK